MRDDYITIDTMINDYAFFHILLVDAGIQVWFGFMAYQLL